MTENVNSILTERDILSRFRNVKLSTNLKWGMICVIQGEVLIVLELKRVKRTFNFFWIILKLYIIETKKVTIMNITGHRLRTISGETETKLYRRSFLV